MRAANRRPLDLPVHPRFVGFEAYAQREIFPWLAGLEGERRNAVRRFRKILAITAAIIAVSLTVSLAVFGMNPGTAIVLFAGFPAFIGIGFAFILLHLLRLKMKAGLMPKVCAPLKLRYTGTSSDFPVADFVASGMIPHHDRYGFEDGIASEESGIAFAAAEATFSVRRRSKGNDRYDPVWRGLLIAARVPRPFKGITLLMPPAGFVSRLFENRDADQITLGVGSAEDGLEIRSTSPEETRTVLTERVMRRLAELAARLGKEQPSLALKGNHVLLAIRSSRNRFEGGSLWKPMDDPARIENLLQELLLVFEVTEALGNAMRLERGRPDKVTNIGKFGTDA